MARKKETPQKEARVDALSASVYERQSPVWERYVQELRKRIRFPRYYKRTANR